MDLSNNVIIVGAGAHYNYGLPTGAMLREQIINIHLKARRKVNQNITPQNEWEKYKKSISTSLEEYFKKKYHQGQDPFYQKNYNEIQELLNLFSKDFKDSELYSIDRFLTTVSKKKDKIDRYKYYGIIGKAFISYFISKDQKKSHEENIALDWIEYIINNYMLKEDNKVLAIKKLPVIITFNYDTLFERKIRNYARISSGVDAETATAFLKDMRIVHMYGKLPNLVTGFNEDSFSEDYLEQSINSLFVIGEDRNEQVKIIESAHEYLNNAKKIYFLGFGYDEENMRLLFKNFKWSKESLKLFYTMRGVGLSEQKFLNIFTKGKIIKHKEKNNYSDDCLDLIKEKHPLESD